MSLVLLVSVNICQDPYPVYPLGMSVVARGLEDAGHEVRQMDLLADGGPGAVLAAARALRPVCVGLSLRNVDNVDSVSGGGECQFDPAKKLAAGLREAEIPVVIGGAGFSLLPEIILGHLDADYGIVGEGEDLLPELVTRLEAGLSAPRLMRASRRRPQPGPARRDDRLVAYYLKSGGILGVQSKRGCENRCTYCAYPTLEGGRLRHRNPGDVVEEMIALKREHGASLFFFTDAVFNDRAGKHLELAEELVRREAELSWAAYFRPSDMARDDLRLLKRSGLAAVEAGTDAGCDATLEALRKPFTWTDVRAFHELCVSERVPCAHFVIFGGPGEDETTLRQGIIELNALQHAVVFPFAGIRLHRGTQLYARAMREGVVQREDPLLLPTFYFAPGLDRQLLHAELSRGFAGRRNRIYPPQAGQERMRVMRGFGYNGLLWDTLIDFDRDEGAGLRRSVRRAC
ncbi:MAG: cobalamin-dependent protein [Proteobacteria bacterium]|nr:cobalamin-dependent protein [Pseudomonadota bacterium]MBU1595067.1 cobalamin-dependent protein [Pseudomonadota bacterium]